MSRWIRVQTSIFDHELFAAAELSQREAWLWLVANVAWKETRHRIGNEVVSVPVGSIFTTLRALQTAWRWKSDKRVRSFISMLEAEGMISANSDAGKTQISVCNYSRYQDAGRNEDANGTHSGRSEDAQKTPLHQNTSSSSLRSEETRARKAEFDQAFWPAYPHKVGKPKAEEAYLKARSQADLEAIIAGLRAYAAKTDDRPWCNPATWLNQHRWADRPAAAPPRGNSQGPPPRKKTILDLIDEDLENHYASHRDDYPGSPVIEH